MAFDGSLEQRFAPLSSLLPSLVAALAPPAGFRVRVTSGGRSKVLLDRFGSTSVIRASALARGGSIELFDGDHVAPASTTLWVAHAPEPSDVGAAAARARAPHIIIGWSTPRPADSKRERAVTVVSDDAIHLAGTFACCIGGLVTAQGVGITYQDESLSRSDAVAYEELAGTADEGRTAKWLRDHARSPGWRVLVPRAGERHLAKERPPQVDIVEGAAGTLVRVDTSTPFAMKALTSLERYLLPLWRERPPKRGTFAQGNST